MKLLGKVRSTQRRLPGTPEPALAELTKQLREETVRRYLAGELPQALEAARRLLEIQRRELGEWHPNYAVGLANVRALQAMIIPPSEAAAPPPAPTQTPIVQTPVILHSAPCETDTKLANEPTSPVISAPSSVPVSVSLPVLEPHPVLERILRLGHQSPVGHSESLAEVHSIAEALSTARSANQSEPSSTELKPFEALLRMIDQGSALANDDWLFCHDAIVKHFGKPMARAAASGKIVDRTPGS